MLRSGVAWVRQLAGGSACSDGTTSASAQKYAAPAPAAAPAVALTASVPGGHLHHGSKAARRQEVGAHGVGDVACALRLDGMSTAARAHPNGAIGVATVKGASSITIDKEANASPTASQVTSTEATCTPTEEGDAFDSSSLTPRFAALDAVVARLSEQGEHQQRTPGSPTSADTWSRSSNRSSSEGSRRRRKKPPIGLPPCSIVDGLSPSMVQRYQAGGAQDAHSWCSAPVCAPLPKTGSAAQVMVDDSRALDTQRRAEWVEDSGLSV